jgi:hypothetical protein
MCTATRTGATRRRLIRVYAITACAFPILRLASGLGPSQGTALKSRAHCPSACMASPGRRSAGARNRLATVRQVAPRAMQVPSPQDRRAASRQDGSSPQLRSRRDSHGRQPDSRDSPVRRQAHVTVSSHLTDGRGLCLALRRTSIWCPHNQVLSRSRTAMLPGGSPARPKLR